MLTLSWCHGPQEEEEEEEEEFHKDMSTIICSLVFIGHRALKVLVKNLALQTTTHHVHRLRSHSVSQSLSTSAARTRLLARSRVLDLSKEGEEEFTQEPTRVKDMCV